MSPDDVFTLLTAADPVPDGDVAALAPVLERLRPPDNGSPPMTLTTTEPIETSPGSSGPRRWTLAAAAAIVVLGLGAYVLTRDDDALDEPVDPPVQSLPAVPTPQERAIEAGRTYIDAVNRGDTDTALAMTNPATTNIEADRNMIEMLGVLQRAHGEPAVGPCGIAAELDAWIDVGCEFTVPDPVWRELGVDELVFPVRVYDDGTAKWLPFEGADFSAADWAYTDYLSAFHLTEYEAACLPAAYPIGSVHTNANSALTAACAELRAPLADDVVQWLRDDRPQP